MIVPGSVVAMRENYYLLAHPNSPRLIKDLVGQVNDGDVVIVLGILKDRPGKLVMSHKSVGWLFAPDSGFRKL